MGDTDITLRDFASRFAVELARGVGVPENAQVIRACTSLPASERTDEGVIVFSADVLGVG